MRRCSTSGSATAPAPPALVATPRLTSRPDLVQDNNWIDRQTRLVAVMMNLLEPNSGYTTVVKMVCGRRGRWSRSMP